MIARAVLCLVLLFSDRISCSEFYNRMSESEHLRPVSMGHIIPWSAGALAGATSFYALRILQDRITSLPAQNDANFYPIVMQGGLLCGRFFAAAAAALMIKSAAYTVINHKEWPIRVAQVVRGQIDDYLVIHALRKELVLLSAIAADFGVVQAVTKHSVQERLRLILELYQELIQTEFDALQKFSYRIGDEQTNGMLDALEQDFNAATRGELIDRTTVLTITRGGATSWYRDTFSTTMNIVLSGMYENSVSPLAQLYLLIDAITHHIRSGQGASTELCEKAEELNERIVHLCDVCEASCADRLLQFKEAEGHCIRIAHVYRVFDSIKAVYLSMKFAATTLFY